jgi:hypothetical protein
VFLLHKKYLQDARKDGAITSRFKKRDDSKKVQKILPPKGKCRFGVLIERIERGKFFVVCIRKHVE